MPIKNYSLLKGNISDIALDDDESPHIELRIEAENTSYRAAINVRSSIAPHDLLYLRFNDFAQDTLTTNLATFPYGMTEVASHNPAVAVDYVHDDLFQKSDMSIAPYSADGDNNDLKDFIIPISESAKNNNNIDVYVLGEAWGPEPGKADKYFGFLPGNGIHDIHMNQGSRGRFAWTNGAKQDGALFFHIKDENRWVAIFLAFQSQDWETDPSTGKPLRENNPTPVETNPLKPSISIIAALINAAGEEEGKETVTIINRSDQAIDLTGWSLTDKQGRSMTLAGELAAGMTQLLQLPSGNDAPRLSNKGGKIILSTDDGSIADSVSYDKQDVARDGWTSIFK